MLGLEQAAGGDEVFLLLVLARIIEPVSKLDSLRVLAEAGIAGPSYATLKRRLPAYAKEGWRQELSASAVTLQELITLTSAAEPQGTISNPPKRIC